MKKKILIGLSLFMLLLLGAYLWRYHIGNGVENKIPDTATKAIRVNLRNLEKDVLHDVITNPFSALRSDKKTEGDTLHQVTARDNTPGLLQCIALPKSLILSATEKDEWSTQLLEVKDPEKLKAYLLSKGYMASSEDRSSVYQKGKQTVVVEGNNAQWSYQKEEMSSESGKKEFLKSGDFIFDKLNSKSNDFVYADNDGNYIELNFVSGAIEVEGTYQIDFLKKSARVIDQSGVGGLSVHFDMDALIERVGKKRIDQFTNFTKLDADSLSYYLDGQLLTQFHDFSVSYDTVKTYEYDDDFNKVEVVSVKESMTPSFSMSLTGKKGIYNYMKAQKAVVSEEGKDILSIMPLVTTYTSQENGQLNLYTHAPLSESGPSKHKLSGYLKGQQLLSHLGDVEALEHLKNVKDIQFSVSNDDIIRATITMSDSRNALAGLIR